MKFKAQIDVMTLEEILDPQGKVVTSGLHNLGLTDIEGVRIGKHINLFVDAKDEKNAQQIVDNACKKLLANPVMEYYTFRLEKA